MGIKETAIKMAVKKGVKYLKEDVDTNSIKLIDKGLKLTEGKDLYHNALLKLREGMIDPNHEWANFVKHIIEYVDADIIEKLVFNQPLIVEIEETGSGRVFTTKGDNSPDKDPRKVYEGDVIPNENGPTATLEDLF